MAKNPSIQDLISQLGSMSYSAPSGFKGYQAGNFSPIGYKSLGEGAGWNLTQDSFGSLKDDKKKKGSGINLWDVLSGTLGHTGGVVTDHTYNVIDAIKGFKDGKGSTFSDIMELASSSNPATTVAKGVINGGKKQVKNWTDGKLSWGDIPLVGVLNGMDKGWKRGEDIAQDHMGIDNRWGKVGTGIALDIALDPLTYYTGGLSAASKLKKVSEVAEITNQASKLGITGKFKNTDELLSAAKTTLEAKYAKYPNLAGKMVNKKLTEISEQIKTAGNTAYNANINKHGFKMPFMDKFALTDKSTKNLTYRTEASLGSEFKHVADDLIKSAGLNDNPAFIQAIKIRYGVNDIADLTKTQYEDLHKQLKPLADKFENLRGIPDADVTQEVVKRAISNEDFSSLMGKFKSDNVKWKDVQKQLDEIVNQVGHDPKLRASMGLHLAEMVSKYWDNAPIKNFNKVANKRKAESMEWAARFLKGSDEVDSVVSKADVLKKGSPEGLANKHARNVQNTMDNLLDNPYNEMTNAKTKFEHFLNRKNPFDARTLGTGNKFVDSMANHIADASSQRVGESAMFTKGISQVEKFIKKNNITKDEMQEAIYVLEKEAPKHYGKDWTPSSKVQQLADMIKPVINDITENEKGSVLDNLRENYFPHMVNASDDKLKAIQDFMERHPELRGLSSTSKNNKSRTSFDTLAQRDNYIKKLEEAIQKATDDDTIESLRRQQEELAQLFDTDVVSALTRRVREGVRAKSMKAMQDELKKFGMMKTITGKQEPPKGLTRLDSEVAKKLGLGEGKHYMHPDVLKGMERIDEIFTNQGMNKAIRHLNAASDIWRSLVTHYKPSHYVNNIIGNVMINMAAGVKVSDYKMASKLINGYRKGTLTPEQMKLMKSAYKDNVVSGGFLTDAHRSFEFDVKNSTEKLADKVIDNKVISKVRATGEVYDDVTRLANYINGLTKYGSSKKAAEQVREYLFNYNELTNADRHMRTIVPFWNWMKRNIPLQMKLLMENPKFAMNVERFKNLMNDGQEGEEWQKEGGVKIGNRYVGLPSPTHDLNTILNPASSLSSMNPFAKMAIETSMNKNMYTGNPITYGQDNVAPEDLPSYLAKNFGIVGNAYNMAFNEDTTMIEELMNLFKSSSKIRTE